MPGRKLLATQHLNSRHFYRPPHFMRALFFIHFQVYGREQDTFTAVPSHLCYIIREVLKNSCRATVEHGKKTKPGEKLPPVKVIVARGKEDMTIKIEDQGGGIRRSDLQHVWSYMYSTAPKPTAAQLRGVPLDHMSGGSRTVTQTCSFNAINPKLSPLSPNDPCVPAFLRVLYNSERWPYFVFCCVISCRAFSQYSLVLKCVGVGQRPSQSDIVEIFPRLVLRPIFFVQECV